ncbi:MAG: hypothetical protein EA425_15460 [Puniceicoccaceae bacterium]|nr:MAG: hypothetical protein EA425_15460 [Puniceicoccaceae bacterium]
MSESTPPPAGFNLPWHLRHAEGWLMLGRCREAREVLDAIPSSLAVRPEVAMLRLQLHQEEKDWPAAAVLAEAGARREPGRVDWWVAWAYAVRRSRSLPEARDILLEAEIRHGGEAIIQFNLGCYACQLGDAGEARRRVEAAIALQSDYRSLARNDPDLEPLRASGWSP